MMFKVKVSVRLKERFRVRFCAWVRFRSTLRVCAGLSIELGLVLLLNAGLGSR